MLEGRMLLHRGATALKRRRLSACMLATFLAFLHGAHCRALATKHPCPAASVLSFHATFTYFPNTHFPPPPPHPALRLPPTSALSSTHLSFCRRGPCLPLLPDQRFS